MRLSCAHTMPTLDHDSQLKQVAPAASPQEAAAIVASLERFMRESAPPRSDARPAPDEWQAAAILEGVSRDPWAGTPHPWLRAGR
jgi:hypothetical protein